MFRYIWATISFGIRFSNLTHRGIIAAGPYYFLKHPAYVGKLCSFFLISVPFVNGVKDVLRWGLLVGVYYWRAQTEMHHLRAVGPAYAQYERELAERWARWARWLPRCCRSEHGGERDQTTGTGEQQHWQAPVGEST